MRSPSNASLSTTGGAGAAGELPRGRILRQLCKQGNVAMLRRMIDAGAPIDAPQEDGCTGLWLAAEAGHADVVALLATAGANVNTPKPTGNIAPIYVAAQNGHAAVVDVLLLNGANPNVAKATGATPVFIACQQNFPEIVGSLLRAGANPNAATLQGVTPLMIAAHQGHMEVARRLLQGGADPHLVSAGRTALDWAASADRRADLQRVLDTHIREVEAEVRRRQQQLMQSGAAALIGGGGGGGASAVTHATQQQHQQLGSGGSIIVRNADGTATTVSMSRSVARGGDRAGDPGLVMAAQHAQLALASMGLESRFLAPDNGTLSRARAVSSASFAGRPAVTQSVNTRSFFSQALPKEVGAMDRSLGAFGGVTQRTIEEEAQRAAQFRHAVARDDAGGSPRRAALRPVNTRHDIYDVDQQWGVHCDRVLTALDHAAATDAAVSRQLAESAGNNLAYAVRSAALRADRERVREAINDQRQQSAATHGGAPSAHGFMYPRLPSKKLNSLHEFMAAGADAKGPAAMFQQRQPGISSE